MIKNYRNEKITIFDKIFIFGIFSRIFISNNLLSQFTSYTSQGGSYLEKVHFGTMLIFVAFIMTQRASKFEFHFQDFRRWSWALFAIISFSSFVVILRFGISSTAYIIDTFIVSIVAGLFLARCDFRVARYTFNLIIAAVMVNSMVALFERIFLLHLLPIPSFQFAFFRAYAIFGHPLLNALITGFVGLFVLSNRSLGRWSFAFFFLSLAAIMAFGARAALIFFISFGLLSEFNRLTHGLKHGKATLLGLVATPAMVLVLAAFTSVLLFQTTFGERFVAMSDFTDNSAAARIQVLAIYDSLSSQNFWFGISPEYKNELVAQTQYFSIIENFWVDISLSFGMLTFIAFAAIFVFYLLSVSRSHYINGFSAFAFFLMVSSTNNALSVKTPALLVFVCLLIAARNMAAARLEKSVDLR